MSDAERPMIWVCRRHPTCRHPWIPTKQEAALSAPHYCVIGEEHPMELVEVVEASELERVEAERDALTKAMEPLVEFAQHVVAVKEAREASVLGSGVILAGLGNEASDVLRQVEQIVREGLAAQEERP